MRNHINKILTDVEQQYNGRWSEFAVSRKFDRFDKICPKLSDIGNLIGVSAALLHKNDINLVDLTILTELSNEFDILCDSKEIALFTRRGLPQGLKAQRYLVAADRQINALIAKRSASPADRRRILEERQAKFLADLDERLNIRPVSYIGDGVALTVTKFGQMLYVDTRDVSLSPHLLVSGDWEPGITDVFRSRIKPGMRYAEVGANCGWFTLQAAALVGCTGSVVAFEPNPRYADLLHKTLTINGCNGYAKVVSSAVSNHNGELDFYIFDNFRGNSTLFLADVVAKTFLDQYHKIKVPSQTLNNYFSPGQKIDFLKIDAESAEVHILEGGERLLQDNPDIEIIVEASPYRNGSKDADVVDVLERMGFTCLRITSDGQLSRSQLRQEGAGVEIFATRSNVPPAIDEDVAGD